MKEPLDDSGDSHKVGQFGYVFSRYVARMNDKTVGRRPIALTVISVDATGFREGGRSYPVSPCVS